MNHCKFGTFSKLRSAVARHREIAERRRELEQSSDRALAEMGIARGDIAAIANGVPACGAKPFRLPLP